MTGTAPDIDGLAGTLQAIPGVVAVTLGGSRAHGDAPAGSDWDLGLYYRGTLDADAVRALGHPYPPRASFVGPPSPFPGTVVDPGEWGRLMNGGAWWEVDGAKVDVLYRDLDVVEHWWAQARQGRFEVDDLLGHLAGLPTYAVVGELALNRQLTGDPLPRPTYPDPLREAAARAWRWRAEFHRRYSAGHRRRGDDRATGALLVRADLEEAHARLAERGEWVLNEKGLLARAGLDSDPPDQAASPSPGRPRSAASSAAARTPCSAPPSM